MRCWHCKTEFDKQHALRIAENRFLLHWGDWDGWRFSGPYLIAPGKAGRITAGRLRGIMWEESARSRRHGKVKAGAGCSVTVLLPRRERRDGQA